MRCVDFPWDPSSVDVAGEDSIWGEGACTVSGDVNEGECCVVTC